MNEFVLWGVEPGTTFEDLIGVYTDEIELRQAKQKAIAAGFEKVRIMIYRGEKPDFIGAITK